MRNHTKENRKKIDEYLNLFLIRENGMSGSIFMIPTEEIYIGLGI